jgi:hypothetical protein
MSAKAQGMSYEALCLYLLQNASLENAPKQPSAQEVAS